MRPCDAATGGHVFNRKDKRSASGEVQPILDRSLQVKDGAKNSVFNNGRDFTSLPDRSRFKYRIPNTSVVNKVGDCKLFCCCGWRLTAAQWVWIANLICFLAHTAMVFLVAYFAWWSKDLEKYDTNPYHIKIYRITASWTNETAQVYEMAIEDNGMPIDLAWATLSFFLISAVFHLFALVAGMFEALWFVYWRQIDDCFCYWRWAEYSGSASLMGMLIAISIGIRDQNTLALIFMAMFVTMWLGCLTELYSRAVIRVDNTEYKYPVGRLGFVGKPDYKTNPNALHLISQTHWEGDRPLRDGDGNMVATSFDYVGAQRTSNYIRRMVPHVLGIFSFAGPVVVMVYHFEHARWRLTQETEYEMPDFVPFIIYGSLILFSSFALVQILFQYLPPGFYWGSEICYCILSLTAKLWLGWLILINVIMVEGRAEDLLGGAALEPARR